MKSPISNSLLSVFQALLILANFTSLGFSADEPAFKSPAAVRANARYLQSVGIAQKRFVDELDRTLVYALKAGALEEANQINEAKKLPRR